MGFYMMKWQVKVLAQIGWLKSGRIQYMGFRLGGWLGSSQGPIGQKTRSKTDLSPSVLVIGLWSGPNRAAQFGHRLVSNRFWSLGYGLGLTGLLIWAQIGFKVGSPSWVENGFGQGKLTGASQL